MQFVSYFLLFAGLILAQTFENKAILFSYTTVTVTPGQVIDSTPGAPYYSVSQTTVTSTYEDDGTLTTATKTVNPKIVQLITVYVTVTPTATTLSSSSTAAVTSSTSASASSTSEVASSTTAAPSSSTSTYSQRTNTEFQSLITTSSPVSTSTVVVTSVIVVSTVWA